MRINRENCIKDISKICTEYAEILGRVILFGSVARGGNKDDSDIDLYIEPRDITMTTSRFERTKEYREFRLKLFELYNGEVDYDILSFGGKRELENVKKTFLWTQIEKDGVIVYDGRTEKNESYDIG